jgi:hypothetical protein
MRIEIIKSINSININCMSYLKLGLDAEDVISPNLKVA